MHSECRLRVHVQKILFSNIFSEKERECSRKRCDGFNNDGWLFFYVTHCAAWQNLLIWIILFPPKIIIEHAIGVWGTVWQRVFDQNTVVWRNYSEQNLKIALVTFFNFKEWRFVLHRIQYVNSLWPRNSSEGLWTKMKI